MASGCPWLVDTKCEARLRERNVKMLWTIIAILLILWLIGWLAFSVGAFIHILLVVALVVLIIQLFTGRRAV